MKKIKLMITVAIVSIGFTACNTDGDSAQKEVEVLSTYVDSIYDLTPVYTTANWTEINDGYQERVQLAEKHEAAQSEELKTKADAIKIKYDALKIQYELKIKESEAAALAASEPNFRRVLRDRLFGEGKVGDDMKFPYVTGDNIRGIFQNFVNVVADNKNKFSREDWDEINVLYEALNTRKNVVEKDLATRDNMKIAGLKIRYASIVATHRGGTKVKENKEAKM